jgi:acetyltransferase-like isoleucine patch superfamily enzyme
MMKKLILKFISFLPLVKTVANTRGTQTPVNFTHLIWQKFLGFNRKAYWPVHFTSIVTHPNNIYAGVDTSPGYSPGCYIQGKGKIYVGDYTQIAPNVGIISSNHDLYDNSKHILGKVIIGKYCWLGMGALIMPGVELGNFTIVGAGSVVTKSFTDGYCVIAGNPARLIKTIDKAKCVEHKNAKEFNGFHTKEQFDKRMRNKINI